MSGRHAGTATLRRRSALLLAVATALGVWFGVSAPELSPVATPAPVAQVQPAPDAVVAPAAPPANRAPQRRDRP